MMLAATKTLQKLAALVKKSEKKEEKIKVSIPRILVKIFIAFGIVAYIALAPAVSTPLYYMALFFPWRYPTGDYDKIVAIDSVPVQNVYFKSKNGKQLHGWYFSKPGAKYTALYHHGNGANISVLGVTVDMFLRNNISILLYDYQGYGKSEGEPSLQNVVDDSDAAYKYLVEKLGVKQENVIHAGGSFGSGLAGHIAETHPGKAIVMLTPYATLIECARLRIPYLYIYPDFLMPHPDLNSKECLKHSHAPFFMVHGDSDWIIPVSQPDELFAEAQEPKEYLRLHNVNHGNFITEEFQSRLDKFLQKLN